MGNRGYPGDRSDQQCALRRSLGLRKRTVGSDFSPVCPEPRQSQPGPLRLGTDRWLQRERRRFQPLFADATGWPGIGDQADGPGRAVVVAFGGGEGQGSPSGWVVAFDTAKLASGSPVADVWCSTPDNSSGNGGGGGIWMANAAPAIDANGDIYVVTGERSVQPGILPRSTR